MKRIKIMIVEDNRKFRQAIAMMVDEDPKLELTGAFGAAEVALRSLAEREDEANAPDVVLLDINLPGISGLDAIPKFLDAKPTVRIIVLTQSDAEVDVLTASRSGISGYLLKSSTTKQIKEGIATVMQGGATLDKNVAIHYLRMLQDESPNTEIKNPLSAREYEILKLMSQGMAKKQIANELNVSFGSVATYVRRIYEKLHVDNAPAAVHEAHRIGLLSRK